MASKRDPYLTTQVKQFHHSRRKVNKLVKQGWEVTSTTQIGTSNWHVFSLRKPNPKYKPKE